MISGLAWSGRGKVKRVDVSLDGGRNWREAKVDGLVLDKACVRFYAEFDWNGAPLLLAPGRTWIELADADAYTLTDDAA